MPFIASAMSKATCVPQNRVPALSGSKSPDHCGSLLSDDRDMPVPRRAPALAGEHGTRVDGRAVGLVAAGE